MPWYFKILTVYGAAESLSYEKAGTTIKIINVNQSQKCKSISETQVVLIFVGSRQKMTIYEFCHIIYWKLEN